MEDFHFPRNTLIIQALSPVHIGSGNKLKANLDFILVDGKVSVIDERKLLAWVSSDPNRRLADDFVTHIERGQPLSSFLEQHHKAPQGLIAYQVTSDLTTSTPIGELQAFIKNPANQPYLPGSSLKGSLRSSLLRGVMIEKTDNRRFAEEQIKFRVNQPGKLRSASDDIQSKVFTTGGGTREKVPNYDLNRVWIFRDSETLDCSFLDVIEVQIFSHQFDGALKPKSMHNRPVPIIIEALRPGKKIPIEVTWQPHLLDSRNPASKLELHQLQRLIAHFPDYCRAASIHIMNREIRFYQQHSQSELAGWFENKRDLLKKTPEDTFILPLGWGSGYDPKTITDLLSPAVFRLVADNYRNTQGLGRPGNYRDNEWLGPDLSPKSKKIVIRNGRPTEPVGWVAIAIKPRSKDEPDWWHDLRINSKASKPVFLETSHPPAQINSVAQVNLDKVQERTFIQEKQATAPQPQPIIQSFTSLPGKGDRFFGIVIASDFSGRIVLEIPGLSADDVAAAIIPPEENLLKVKFAADKRVLCEVIRLEKFAGGLVDVICRMVE